MSGGVISFVTTISTLSVSTALAAVEPVSQSPTVVLIIGQIILFLTTAAGWYLTWIREDRNRRWDKEDREEKARALELQVAEKAEALEAQVKAKAEELAAQVETEHKDRETSHAAMAKDIRHGLRGVEGQVALAKEVIVAEVHSVQAPAQSAALEKIEKNTEQIAKNTEPAAL